MSKAYIIDGADFVGSNCISCGIRYFVPKALYESHLQAGGYHSCPNGHMQGWSKGQSEIEKLRRERDLLKQQTAQLSDDVRQNREGWNKAAKEVTRLKKRAKAGTCPCCNRTFSNMSRHMQTQHPEFDPDKVVSIDVAKRKA
jgi:hypothetical protein